jgi:hypothetical protein
VAPTGNTKTNCMPLVFFRNLSLFTRLSLTFSHNSSLYYIFIDFLFEEKKEKIHLLIYYGQKKFLCKIKYFFKDLTIKYFLKSVFTSFVNIRFMELDLEIKISC